MHTAVGMKMPAAVALGCWYSNNNIPSRTLVTGYGSPAKHLQAWRGTPATPSHSDVHCQSASGIPRQLQQHMARQLRVAAKWVRRLQQQQWARQLQQQRAGQLRVSGSCSSVAHADSEPAETGDTASQRDSYRALFARARTGRPFTDFRRALLPADGSCTVPPFCVFDMTMLAACLAQ